MKHKTILYQQLYEKLKTQIIEGQFNAHDKFPSKRQLSQHLSLSQTTIEHAYHLLLDEGFIYSKPRSGYYVSDIESLPMINKNDNTLQDYSAENVEHFQNEDEYAFNLSEIDTEHFPMDLFRKFSKEVFENDKTNLLQRGDVQGEKALRQQISHYLFNSRGVTCHPDQIIVGSSTEQLLNMLTDLLIDASFIIEHPSYPPIKQVLDKKQKVYEQIDVHHDGIDMEKVLNSIHNIIYITPSHQFPTGYIMNLKKRTQLINWAQEKADRYIIEDDYDSEFRYYGKPIPALQSLDTKDKVIYISTFSKSIFPSCRVAYIVLPPLLLHDYKMQKYKEGNTVPVHIQKIITQFMKSGSFERHLNKMRKIYRYKLNYLLEKLSPYFNQLKVQGAETGMHFNLIVTNGLSLKECLQRAKSLKLNLKVYDYEDTVFPTFILGFGGIKNDDLEAYTNVLIKALTIGRELDRISLQER